MDFSERNSKVAISRWKKELAAQKEKFSKTKDSYLLRAELCGFLAGDGSVRLRKEGKWLRHDIGFFPDNEHMLDAYLRSMKTVYNIVPTVRRLGKFFSARFTSRAVLEDLQKYASFGIHSWTLPSELFKIQKAREYWLRAFFSAEAYIGVDRIKIQTVNIAGMLEVSNVLTSLGIDHRSYEYAPKNSRYSRVGIINILKKEERKKFLLEVGFHHTKKEVALRSSVGL